MNHWRHERLAPVDRIAVVLFSVALAIVTFVAAEKMLKRDFERQLQAQVASAFDTIMSISDEVLSHLRDINALGIEYCDDEALLEMRRTVFVSSRIIDMGYLRNGALICSTGMGVLDEPVPSPLPDFVGPRGAKVWTRLPIMLTNGDVSALVVEVGDFNAVLRRDFLDDLIGGDVDWLLEFVAMSSTVPISGSAEEPGTDLIDRDMFSFWQRQCHSSLPYCITVAATEADFWHQYRPTLTGWGIIALLVFTLSMLLGSHDLNRYRSTEARVMRGLSRDAFYCLYQPIVELCSGRIIGCEVLARYEDAKGPLFPDRFIPIILARGKTWPFTQAIIRRALSDLHNAAELPDGFRVNINFFAQDIESGRVLELLRDAALTSSRFQFVIEVTEDEKLASPETSSILTALTESRFLIAIDDFGTGYSNLRQIRDFNCHSLKIDRSFIAEMEGGSIRSTLIPHIVDIAQKIDANVVAEGIENTLQQQALLEVGVRYGQGYMFGKPMPLKKLATPASGCATECYRGGVTVGPIRRR